MNIIKLELSRIPNKLVLIVAKYFSQVITLLSTNKHLVFIYYS